MRCFSKDSLDTKVFLDREKTMPTMVNGKIDATVRDYLRYIIDLPTQDKKLTREISKTIDRIYEATQGDDAMLLEDADYNYLKNVIETVGIHAKPIFDLMTRTIDEATLVKPTINTHN